MKKLILPLCWPRSLPAAAPPGCDRRQRAGRGPKRIAHGSAGNVDGRNLPAVLTDPKSILSKRSIYFDLQPLTSRPTRGSRQRSRQFLTNNRRSPC